MTVQITPKLATPADYARILKLLRRDPGSNAWAIQDLIVWPETTRLYFCESENESAPLDYLLLTGHPGAQRVKTVVLSGSAERASSLLSHLPEGNWVAKETNAALLSMLQAAAPGAKVFLERRMETTREKFRPQPGRGKTRRLIASDAQDLAKFQGMPPQTAANLLPWIEGAFLYGTFEGTQLAAIASTFVRLPDVCELVAVSTHQEYRGRGYASEVTSALTADCLEIAPVVSLTVVADNAPAIGLYEKLGFYACEARVWVDNGTNARP